MKKLFLSILVICSLLGGNAYAKIIQLKCKGGNYYYLNVDIDTTNRIYFEDWHSKDWAGGMKHSDNYRILSLDDKKVTYMHTKKGFLRPEIIGTFQFKSPYYTSRGDSHTNLICVDETVTQKSSTSTDDKITQSKQICKDLGFKTNTEKFADCALKMMTIEFETTNKVASSGGTKQEIIIKQQNDYDVFDAMLDISNSMLSNNSGNSSSSSSSSGTRCIAQKTHAWGHTVINCN